MDCSPPGSFVWGILQARLLQWFAMPFSRVSSRRRNQTQVSHIVDRFFTIWGIYKDSFLNSTYIKKKKTYMFGHLKSKL